MTDFAARISRVRMKSGGADVTVIHSKPLNPEGEDWRGKLVANARKIADVGTEQCPLVGYFVMGIFADGLTSTGFRHDLDACPIPPALMPSWIAEVVRRDMITQREAESVFDDRFEWVEG